MNASDPAAEVTLAEGTFLALRKRGRWEYAHRVRSSGAVMIVAVTDDGKLILTEQLRLPFNRPVIELPAGLAGDTPGDEHEACAIAAQRELLEETGYEAREMTLLAEGPTSAGLSTETVALFRAVGLHKTGAGGGDDHEDITVHEIPLAAVPSWLAQKTAAGVLVDLKVYAGLYFARGSQ
jgi:ADP-ribose pyrophosphatase